MCFYRRNFSVRFINISTEISNYAFYTENREFFSAEAYFRLLTPFILTRYDRAIYMDGDMVALTDLAELMKIDMDCNLMAAVRDYCGLGDYYNPKSQRKQYMEERLRLHNPDNYYISGLLLFNLKNFRNTFTREQVLEITASFPWQFHDQDILNILTEGRTLLLDPRWNVLQDFGTHQFLPKRFYQEWSESLSNPAIVHYAGSVKPWRFPRIPRAEYFWLYASKSPFYNRIIAQRSQELQENRLYRLKYCLQWLLPLGSRSRVLVKRWTRPVWSALKRRLEESS